MTARIVAIDPQSDSDTIAIHIPDGDEHVCILQIDDEHYPEQKAERNAHLIVLAWNCLVTAADKLGVDPLELADALGDGRLGALLTVRGKPWESDSQFAEALERLVHLPKRESAQ